MVEPLEAGATQERTTRELPEVNLATGLPGALAASAGTLSVVRRVVRTAMTTIRIRFALNTISPTLTATLTATRVTNYLNSHELS
jgi:hypothetical protein